MTSSDLHIVGTRAGRIDLMHDHDDSIGRQAALSTAIAAVFRGRFCDVLLAHRRPMAFAKNSVIYDVGDRKRAFYFLQSGFVKLGAIAADGREVIYDVRKGGDVVGELSASEPV